MLFFALRLAQPRRCRCEQRVIASRVFHKSRTFGLSEVIAFVGELRTEASGFAKRTVWEVEREEQQSSGIIVRETLRRESDLDPLALNAGTDSADKFASPKLLAQDDQRPIVKRTHRTKEVVLKTLVVGIDAATR
jgi:hypothetical protein